MRWFSGFFIGMFLFWSTAADGQTARQEAAVAPLGAIGEIPESQQQIIFNSLLEKLSETFDLVSQEAFENAQTEAFESLGNQNCTEAQCIQKIQELLQIENVFILQWVRDGALTQLTLTRIDLNKKTVKTSLCSNCETLALVEKVRQLTDQLLSQSFPLGEAASSQPSQEDTGTQALSEEPEQESDPQRWILWRRIVTGASLAAWTSLYLENEETKNANDDSRTQEKKMASAVTPEEQQQAYTRAKSRASSAKTHAQNAQNALILALGLSGTALWMRRMEPEQNTEPAAWRLDISPETLALHYRMRW